MELYFEGKYGEWIYLCDCADKVEAHAAIQKFLDDHHYKSYYWRTWEENGWKNYDVGSWSEFFHWKVSSEAKVPEGAVNE